MKKILGLDLGTTSIGWAFVNESDDDSSKIINTGVRIVPLTTDEESDFAKGNTISINSDRTLKRGARRGLQRFKLRRDALIEIFDKIKFIPKTFNYAENGKQTTFSSHKTRAKSVFEQVTKAELVQILLMLNKKRGYKSSRKAKTPEEGDAIDGMKIATEIFEKNITPGQWIFNSLSKGGKFIPDFYRSDLQKELEKIINFQHQFYSGIINEKLIVDINGKTRTQTSQHFSKILKIELAENKGSRDEVKMQHYKWRNDALFNQLDLKVLAFIITEINNQINKSSGYLGAISDRSKELYFNKLTVGQFQYNQLQENIHKPLKNQVFYRQDYIDEFEKIWETQSKFYPELTDELKIEIKDITIFYQRKLKSQKHLVSQCEFEKGHKVIPKSSPLFQDFRIWQNINNIIIKNEATKESFELFEEQKEQIAIELKFKGNLSDSEILTLLGFKKGTHSVNFKKIEGNRTNNAIYKAFEKILEIEGYEMDFSKMKPLEIKESVFKIFELLEIDTKILDFDETIQGNDFDKQAYYQFWHLLYATEDDETLKKSLMNKFGFKENHIPSLLNINLQADYGSLCAKAIKKILPHLMDGHLYDKSCLLAGYNHSASLTKEDNANRKLDTELQLIKKNSLRNPVVEKILNQMINVVNAIIKDPTMGQPDEIRIELAREIKATSEQRKTATTNINAATVEHEKIRNILRTEFKIARVTRNDIIRYKLWIESDKISIYTGNPIKGSDLFTKEYDIEHIIPKSRLFDDSFSNKTLCERSLNIEKSNKTALSFLQEKFSEKDFKDFENRVNDLFKQKKIKYTKYKKLLMIDSEIPEDFIERQLRETQYIAKKAKEILEKITRNVNSTIGTITNRLRDDWQLVDVMKELNWEKYDKLGLTEIETGKGGERITKIKDWTKRNDHRHHAMDAITIAFTKPAYIQYLNHLNARDGNHKLSNNILGIESKYLTKDKNNKYRFNPPMPNFRNEAKKQLENILISYKTKNKVITKNKNLIKIKGGTFEKTQLTPRGQLHEETVYGKIKKYETKLEKVSGNFTADYIENVRSKEYREALLKRLFENDNDAKKAFTGKNAVSKNPIYLDAKKTVMLPELVKTVWFKDFHTIRKNVNADNFKDLKSLEKVIDVGVKTILTNRLNEFKGEAKKAFANLDENPIWLNKEKGISIKRVSITGISNSESLRNKKDHFGNEILDKDGKTIPVDFVSTGNNHHVAIYEDDEGNLQEEIVTFYDAVIRKNLGYPIINKNHSLGWKFLFTMKKNEFFIFPSDSFNLEEIDLMNPANFSTISTNLFRVQSLSIVQYGNATVRDFKFRHHLETVVTDNKELVNITYKQLKSLPPLRTIVKVRINHLGQIVQIGEY